MYKLTKEKISKDFNPRPHEEGDYPDTIGEALKSDFNPRPHEEGDLRIQRLLSRDIPFQSTPS